MLSRLRFVAGTFALAAMLLSLTGGAWASACAPEMETRTATTAISHEMPVDQDCMPGAHDDRSHDGGPDCPFGPIGSLQGCTAAASLPGSSDAGIAPSPEGSAPILSVEAEPDLILATALFHPPKA